MILVTGGTGFLGSHLLAVLSKGNTPVRAIHRTATVPPSVAGVQWLPGDVLDYHSLLTALDEVTHVYHCAGLVSFYPRQREMMYKVNAGGTANIVNACLETGVTKFLHVSSIAALGRTGREGPITEKTMWEESRLNSHYAVSKHAAEMEVWRGMHEGLKAVIVNPSVIIGPGRWQEGSSRLFLRVWNGLKFYSEGTNGFVDIRDVAACMIKLMDSGIAGERFIISSQNLTYRQVLNMIADAFGKARPAYNPPQVLRELLWRAEMVRSFLFGARPLITRETARISGRHFTYENSKVIHATGIQFTPLSETIAFTCKRFLEEFRLPA